MTQESEDAYEAYREADRAAVAARQWYITIADSAYYRRVHPDEIAAARAAYAVALAASAAAWQRWQEAD